MVFAFPAVLLSHGDACQLRLGQGLKATGKVTAICFSAFLLHSFSKSAGKIARLYLAFCQREIQGDRTSFV